MEHQATATTSPRRLPAWIIVVLGLVAVIILGWLVLRWVMAPPLSGDRSHDFGTVSIVEDPTWVNHVFRLHNTSGKLLTIRRAVPSCGCTETEPFDPVVPVNGQIDLPVRMKLTRSVRETADVTLTFEEAPPMKVYVEAVGRRANPLIIDPPGLHVRPGQVRPVSITMEMWEDSTHERPRIEVPEGLEVTEHPWKRSRVGKPVRGTPSLDRTMIKVAVPEDTLPMTTAIRVVLDDRVVEIPVEVAAQLNLGDHQDDASSSGRASSFNPVGSPGSQVEEDPDDPGANQ